MSIKTKILQIWQNTDIFPILIKLKCLFFNPVNDIPLSQLDEEQLNAVLESLSTNIPLKIAAPKISNESFWKRMTVSRWKNIDVTRHGNNWKRAFFERHLEQTIEEFVPGKTSVSVINEVLEHSAPYVQRLNIKEMLPPKRPAQPKDVRFSSLILTFKYKMVNRQI